MPPRPISRSTRKLASWRPRNGSLTIGLPPGAGLAAGDRDSLKVTDKQVEAAGVCLKIMLGEPRGGGLVSDGFEQSNVGAEVAQRDSHHAVRIGEDAPRQRLFLVVVFGGDETDQRARLDHRAHV